jgi:hypothetical protein
MRFILEIVIGVAVYAIDSPVADPNGREVAPVIVMFEAFIAGLGGMGYNGAHHPLKDAVVSAL